MEPSIVCPNCRTEIKLTETLAAPLIEAVRRESDQKLRSKEAEIVKREAAIRAQQAAMKEAKEAMEAELAERLKGERKKLAEEEARKARAAVSIDLNHKDQQLEELTKAFKEREAKLEEAQKAQAEALRKAANWMTPSASSTLPLKSASAKSRPKSRRAPRPRPSRGCC